MADGADRRRLVRHGDLVDELGDAGEAEAGVLPHRHRRRAGMRVLAGQRHLQPPEALPVGDDADVLPLGLEDRALLDMELEIRLQRPSGDGSSPLKPIRSSSSPKRSPFASLRS